MLVPVRPLTELTPGSAVRLEAAVTGDVAVAVFRTDEGLFAIDDACTHQDAALSDGWLEGCFIECPLHLALFDLRTGEPEGPPADDPVRTHVVVVVDGVVHVELPRAGRAVA